MKCLAVAVFAVLLFHTPYLFAQEAAPPNDVCGHIITPDSYEEDGFWEEPFYTCDNPFETSGTIPYEVRVNDQILVPGETIHQTKRQWWHVSAPAVDAEFQLYKKVGDDYYLVPFQNPFRAEYQDQFSASEKEALEAQFFRAAGSTANYSTLQRFFPSYAALLSGSDALLHTYANQSILLASGEYVLLSTYKLKVFPTYTPRIQPLFLTAHAAREWYESRFTVVIENDSAPLDILPVGPTFTLDPDYKAALMPTIQRNELALHAAELATKVAGNADKYLWNGKGWDQDSKTFVDAPAVLSRYRYWNVNTNRFEYGSGLDCSGLIAWAYNRSYAPETAFERNFIKYANADGQFRAPQSDSITREQLLPGDTASFDWDSDGRIDHTVMYVGERFDEKNGEYNVVHAEGRNRGIRAVVLEDYLSNDVLAEALRGYRRPHLGNVELAIKTLSPVNMIVRDPDGNTLSYADIDRTENEVLREVPGELYYIEIAAGDDGRPEDVVYAPYAKAGTYHILVLPDETADYDDTFSLEVTVQGHTQVLAKDMAIEDPSMPIGFTFHVEGEESAASRGEEGDEVPPPEKTEEGAKGSKKQSSAERSSATRVSTQNVSGKVLGVQTHTLSLLNGVFDYQKNITGRTWQVRHVTLPNVGARIIFNQMSATEMEVLMINTPVTDSLTVQIVHNNKLKTL